MRATYYISFNGTTYTEFYPSNVPILKLEQEAGEIFKRWKVDRFRITRTKNTAYCTLMNMYFDPLSYNSEIYFRVNIKGVPKYYFKDTIRSGKINLQNEVYEIAPKPDDSYEPILRQYTKKWDNTDGDLFQFDETFYTPVLIGFSFSNVDFSSFVDPGGVVTYVNDGDPIGYCYARNPLSSMADNTVITVFVTGLSYTGDAPVMQVVDSSLVSVSNQVIINANGKYELTVTSPGNHSLELSQLNLTESSQSGSFNYVLYFPETRSGGSSVYNIINRLLNHASYFALSPVCSVVSTILWNNPLGSDPPASIDTYMTANPNNDYAIEGPAVFNNLYLCRTDTFTTSKEDNIELCLRDVMDILKSKRLWWFIDEDGKFRIEHEKYFRSYDPQVDLTLTAYDKEMPEVDHFEYSYEDEYFNQVNLTEENAKNEDWTPVRIEYDPLLTGKNIQDLRASVTTDLKNLLDTPSGSGSGLTLLRCDANNNVLFDESLITSGTYYPNQKLSPLWISRYYMDYFAESQSGTLMTGVHTFLHVRETLSQNGIKFTMTSEMDWKKPFTLFIGTGWMGSVQYSPETGWYSVDFLYNPYAVSLGSGSTGGSSTADSTLITVDDTVTVDTI